MKVVIIKGPHFEETKKRAYRYLNTVLRQMAREIEKESKIKKA